MRRWVIVELSSTGEKETDVLSIKSAVCRILRRNDLEVFIPAISQGVRNDSQTLFFMDGYIFVEYHSGVSYLKLRDTSFFRDVLCTSSRDANPSFSLLSDVELEPMRAGTESLKSVSFKIGDQVRVITGTYKNLRGEVSLVYDDGKNVQVTVNHLRSKRGLLVDFPSTYLERSK